MSPVVSPGWVKMGKLVITRDDRNKYSMHLNTAVCALLMTLANSAKRPVSPVETLVLSVELRGQAILDSRFWIADFQSRFAIVDLTIVDLTIVDLT